MNDISVIVEHPLANIRNDEEWQHIPTNIIYADNTNVIRQKQFARIQHVSYWSKHHSSIQACGFVLFTIISMAIGIIVICVTSPNDKNLICDPIFKRTAQRIITYDSNPQYVLIVDIDGDNHSDLVIVNSGIDNIGIRLGVSNTIFQDQIMHSTGAGSQPQWVAVGDLNNDTLLDIIVANYGTNNIGIFLAYQNKTFAPQITYSLNSSRPLSLAIADINNDNILDIIVANNGTFYITILLGSGDGSFHLGNNYYMGHDSMPCAVVVTDFNNDNQSDIVIVNYGTNDIAILLANENGTFLISKYSTGRDSRPRSVIVGDFNNDHYIDIAIANSVTQNIGIFVGNGNGIFQALKTYSTSSKSSLEFIATGDLNNDKNLDLIVANSGENNVVIFEGNGHGNFSIKTNQSTGINTYPCAIAVDDIDHDAKSDIVVVNRRTSGILVFTSYDFYSSAINQKTYSSGSGAYPNSVTVGDVNKDKLLDIVVANTYTNNIGIFIGSGNGAFKDQETFSIFHYGSEPDSVAVGYFNEDTELDIAVVITLEAEVEIYLGQGNGSFKYDNSYTVESDDPNPDDYDSLYPDENEPSDLYSIALADFDDDAILDIVTASCDDDQLIVFYGYGNGTFRNGTAYQLEEADSCPMFVRAGDFNNDGLLDLVCSNDGTTTISIFLNDGNRTFQNTLTISAGYYYPSWVAVKDLNNDGQQDIVFTVPESDKISILLGYGDGSFKNFILYSTGYGSFPSSIILDDFSKDNFVDMAVVNAANSSLNIFLGDGKGNFTAQYPIDIEDSYYPQCIAVGDFNNDSEPDVVVGNTGTDDITVLLLRYQTSFGKLIEYSQGSGAHPFSVTTVDFNQDHQTDIVVANSGDNTVQLLIGYNNGTFLKNITYLTGINSHPRYAITADFNKDNLLDIVVVNSYDNNLMVLLNLDNDTFDTSNIYSTGSESFPNSIGLGDFNKDGWIDIVVANNNTDNIGIFFGYDYPDFTTYRIAAPKHGSSPYYVVTGDFNNDDQYDIAVAYRRTSSIGIFLGNGNGTFRNQLLYSTGQSSEPIALAIGYFNNDSYLDIAVANSQRNYISILLGHGNGSFVNYTSYSTGSSSPVSIAVGDFNNDNILDIVVADRRGNNIGIFIGYGNGSFAKQVLYRMPNGSSPVCVVVNDFNKDKILDIAVANQKGYNIGILLGYGNGNFKNMTTISMSNNSDPYSITAGDFNKDNSIDIAVANHLAGNIQIFVGHGDGTFSLQATYSTGTSSILVWITAKDMNNDAILDIIYSDWGTGYGNLGVLYGLKNGTFLSRKNYRMDFNSEPTSVAIGDFNNDGRMDFATSNSRKNNIEIMLQDQTEPFGTQVTFSTGNGSRPYSVAVMDLNNDDQLDIAVSNFMSSKIGIFLGVGNGSFLEQKTYSTGNNSGPMFITIGDLNNDKQMDIVVANSKADNISILYGDGKGAFGNVQTYFTGYSSEPSCVAIADLDKDNHTDIVVANYGINTVLVFNGLGNGIFSEPRSYALEYDSRPASVAIGDFNNDNWLDIAVALNGPGYVDILLQTCSK